MIRPLLYHIRLVPQLSFPRLTIPTPTRVTLRWTLLILLQTTCRLTPLILTCTPPRYPIIHLCCPLTRFRTLLKVSHPVDLDNLSQVLRRLLNLFSLVLPLGLPTLLPI